MCKRMVLGLMALLMSMMATATTPGQWGPSFMMSFANTYGWEPGRQLYVCKAEAHGGMHPGKVVGEGCNIGYGGREEVYPDFEVYMGPGKWVPKYEGLTSMNAVEGGYEPGRNLMVCLAQAHGGWHPGKVVAGNCNIGYGGFEEVIPDFRVLVEH